MSSLIRYGRLGQRLVGKNRCRCVQPIRLMSGGADAPMTYREQKPQHPWYTWAFAALVMYTVTVWIGYNLYTDSGHILGEFPDIDPSKFTDEELGIPPDEEDIYPPGYVPLKDRV